MFNNKRINQLETAVHNLTARLKDAEENARLGLVRIRAMRQCLNLVYVEPVTPPTPQTIPFHYRKRTKKDKPD